MAGIVFGVFCLVSVVCAAVTGHSAEVGAALFAGTEDAVGADLIAGNEFHDVIPHQMVGS